MRRREFVSLLGAAAAWSIPARAQQTARRPRLGVLLFGTAQNDPNTQLILRGLRDLGYIDGQNIDIEYRYAEGKLENVPQLAGELVRLKPDVLFVVGGDLASHCQQGDADHTDRLRDERRSGAAWCFDRVLPRPGGNATGVTFLSDELAAKRLEVLKEAAPRISRVAFLSNPDHADNELPVAKRAAANLGVQLQSVDVRGPGDFEPAFNAAARTDIDAVYVVSSRQMVANVPRIVEFATKNRLPLAGGWGAWVQAGGLVSYGPNVGDMVRQATSYLDKILKGAKPGDLPVQQPTRFELLINLKTAKALGLTIPEAFLLRADKVIE